MGPKVTALSKITVAFSTFKRLLPCVSPYVDFQSARAHEWLRAVIALERPLACMPPKMIAQMSMRRKCTLAARKVAFKWFFSVMYPHMRLQIAFFREFLATRSYRARKWLLPALTTKLQTLNLHESACGFWDDQFANNICRRSHNSRACRPYVSIHGFSNAP